LNFFTETETGIICSNFEPIELQPDEGFIAANTTSNLLGFVAKGILRAVEPKENGERIIHYFWEENNFFSEAESYFENKPTRFSIEAAMPCTLLYTTKEKLDTLELEIATLGLVKTQFGAQIMYEKSRMQEIAKKGDVKTCYQLFLNEYPKLANRLSIKNIASFLNTTPSHLSFIRKQLFKL